MGSLSYATLLKRYKELKKNKEKQCSMYYYEAYKKQKEDIENLKNEIKKIKKDNIELSLLIEYLRGNYNGRI